jgi:hypothetical protein
MKKPIARSIPLTARTLADAISWSTRLARRNSAAAAVVVDAAAAIVEIVVAAATVEIVATAGKAISSFSWWRES